MVNIYLRFKYDYKGNTFILFYLDMLKFDPKDLY